MRDVLYQAYALFLDSIRTPAVVFWMVVFPVALALLFGSMYSPHVNVTIPVYLVNNTESPFTAPLARALNSSAFSLKVVGNVSDPKRFVVDKTLGGNYVVLVVPGARSIDIYSSSTVYGGYVEGFVYSMFARGALPVNVSTVYVGVESNGTAFIQESPVEVTLSLMLYIPISAISLTSGLLDVLAITGVDKRMFLSPMRKTSVLSALFLSVLIFDAVDTLILTAISKMAFGVPVGRLFAPIVLLSFMVNQIFSFSVGVLLHAALSRRESRAHGSQAGVPLFLFFAFTTGYFVPYDVLPDALKAFARTMPTFYTLWTAQNYLAYGAFDAGGLLYAAVVSTALLVLAGLLYPVAKRL
ncbi:MAG: ABC transporter permease [Pyrobaculum sp.]